MVEDSIVVTRYFTDGVHCGYATAEFDIEQIDSYQTVDAIVRGFSPKPSGFMGQPPIYGNVEANRYGQAERFVFEFSKGEAHTRIVDLVFLNPTANYNAQYTFQKMITRSQMVC